MITGELRNKVDRIWETFWTGGITNPLDVIEQFTYLLFIKQIFLECLLNQCFPVIARNIGGADLKI